MVGLPKIFHSYPLKVQIAEVRGNAIRWDWDRARVMKGKGGESFELRKRGDRIPITKFKQLQVDRKGKSVVNLISPALGKYEPLEVDLNPSKLIVGVEESDMAFWGVLETRRIDEIYRKQKGMWEKYGHFIMLMMTAAVLAFTVIYVTQALEGISHVTSGVAQPLAAAVDRLADLLEKTALAPQPGG